MGSQPGLGFERNHRFQLLYILSPALFGGQFPPEPQHYE